MSKAFTIEELNTLSGNELDQVILAQQEQINTLQANYEKMIEQIRIADQARFGHHSEKLDVIDRQLSLFDEAETFSNPKEEESPDEEVVQSCRRRRPNGKRGEDLKGFPEELHHHSSTKEELDAFYGEGNWGAREPEVYKCFVMSRPTGRSRSISSMIFVCLQSYEQENVDAYRASHYSSGFLELIGSIYHAEEKFKDLPVDNAREKERSRSSFL